MRNMEGVTDRKARFRTVIALIEGDDIVEMEGMVEGVIIDELRGSNGFGYDPVFMPEGYDVTFAEMDAAEKNRISHRGRATEKLRKYLTEKNISS